MVAHIKCMGCTVDVEAPDIKDLIRQVSAVQEVMGERVCGMCGGEDLGFRARKHESYEFFEVRCNTKSCGATLSFGQRKDGFGLFPKEWGKYGATASGGDDSPF